MMWIRRGRALAALALSVAALTATDVAAQEATATTDAASADDRARAHFERGIELYQDQDYAAALVEFRAAYEAVANYRVLYNLAVTASAMHRYADAQRYYSEYLSEGGDQISAERRREAEEELARLAGRVSAVHVEVPMAGAQVELDGVVVGASPLVGPLRVSAGTRTFRVSASGHETAVRTVEIVGGTETRLSFQLVPVTVGAEGHDAAPVALGWTMATLCVLAGGAAVLTGLLTLDADARLVRLLGTFQPSPSEVAATRSDIRTFAALTDGLAIGAALTGALAISFAIGVELGRPRAATAVSVRVGGPGVILRAQF